MTERYWINEFLEAAKTDDGWVYVVWRNNEIGHLSKNFIKTLKLLERKMASEGLPGWFCSSEPEHTGMHHIIEKFGCVFVKEMDGEFWFRKELTPCVADQSEVLSRKLLALSKA